MYRVDLIVGDVDALEVAEVSEGGEARDAVGGEEESADGRGNASEKSDLVVVAVERRGERSAIDLSIKGSSASSQVDLVQIGKELLEPNHAFRSLLAQVDTPQPLPVRLEGLHVGDELDQPIRRDAKGAFGEEGSVGAGGSAEGARGGRVGRGGAVGTGTDWRSRFEGRKDEGRWRGS